MNINDRKKEQEEQEEKERQRELEKQAEAEAVSAQLLEEVESASSSDDEDGMPEGPGFMALYTTLMLLLMTFFIVLVSMSASSTDKFKAGKTSINSTFNVLGLSGSRQALFFMYSFLKIKNTAVKQALDLHDNNPLKKRTDKPQGFLDDGLSFDEATQLNKFIALGFNIDASDKNQKSLKVRFPEKGVFVSQTADFDEIFEATFSPFLKMIGAEYSKMEISVYCLDTPKKSTGFSTTRELAALRAGAIADAIVEIQGVDRSKLLARGFGDYYYDAEFIPSDKREFIELNIFGLWGDTVGEDGIEATEEEG